MSSANHEIAKKTVLATAAGAMTPKGRESATGCAPMGGVRLSASIVIRPLSNSVC
ncbi:MAG: hypothetical protein RIC94_07460 [Phycisphaerales bacterium]